MVVVRISEMYDMSTRKGALGILGIHTPTGSAIARRWHGLMDNYRFMKVLSCDVKIACASTLPLDPLQISSDSTASDKIAPQDVMNPILYRAVSNESWNTVVNKIFFAGSGAGLTDVNSIRSIPNAFNNNSTTDQNLALYYSMLASDDWRKAMPQQGMQMTNLRPLVYPILNTFGNTQISSVNGVSQQVDYPPKAASDNYGEPYSPTGSARTQTFRGPAQPMPRIPCTIPGSSPIQDYPYPYMAPNAIPRSYVCCIVMPPGVNQIFFYRLLVSWKIEFSEICSCIDKESAAGWYDAEQYVYGKQYTSGSKLEEVAPPDELSNVSDLGSIDTLNMQNPSLVLAK